ncbi:MULTISPECIES: class I poly(R)-hydroxyalkanoic acid synthase [unclassified Burkholderia]|uniref:class I poly(R)-hydroxyalkanoic acid synthase n=1 Tax=unclassified Burkholderia TaxID=2613784 RepID=UPI00158F4904|nr:MULTISPECIES: class I poly(R)-hydroxyalkanoic acid synthase [unclassified Burkholderia]
MKTNHPDPSAWWRDLMRLWTLDTPADEAARAWRNACEAFVRWHINGLPELEALWAAPNVLNETAVRATEDRRFSDDAWKKDPRYIALAQHYLAQCEAFDKALSAMPVDDRTKGRWRYLLHQILDAVSPANYLATNPEALQTALDTRGSSLIEGLRLFLEDLAKGAVSMSDDSAFSVGVDLAVTPGSVIFENEVMQLIQYAPTSASVRERPLLIVPPCINKYYILDLQPENSLVAYAVSEGHTVFLVSWRNIDATCGQLQWDDYIERGVLRALDVARDISGADKVNTLGFCIGGTLLACALAVSAARGESRAASVTLLTTLLDFFDAGEIGLLVTESMVTAREMTIGRGGVLRGVELANVFASLRANDLIWPYVVSGYLNGRRPAAFDLLFWNSDHTNLPGPMYCWYLRNAYLENRLRVPGGTVQCGQPVDFASIDVPAFVFASRDDHIVPWKGAYASTRLLGGSTRFVLGASGHIAGVVNPPAKRKRHHWTGEICADPDVWLTGAVRQEGSWWPEWMEWLHTHGGACVEPPPLAGNECFPVIEPAPGRFAVAKAI